MPRLALRRLLIFTEICLIGLCAAGGLYLFKGYMKGAAGGNIVEATALSGDEDVAKALSVIQARSAYEGVISSNLFGGAGQVNSQTPPPVEEKKEEPPAAEEETALPLTLRGTSMTDGSDPLMSSAIVENKSNNSAGSFYIGEAVMENVTLETVRQREVVLLNKNTNKKELLRMEDADKQIASATTAAAEEKPGKPGAGPAKPGAPAASAAAAAAPGKRDTPSRITLKRDEVMQQFFVNYTDIVSKIKPQPYTDPASGKVTGFTATGLNDIPLAKTLDLRDGDVLQTINNEVVDSEAKVIELINKYQNATVFRLGIVRDNAPRVVTYRIE